MNWVSQLSAHPAPYLDCGSLFKMGGKLWQEFSMCSCRGFFRHVILLMAVRFFSLTFDPRSLH